MNEINTTSELTEADPDVAPAWVGQPTIRQRLKLRAEQGAALQHQARRTQASAAAFTATEPATAEPLLEEAAGCEAKAAELLEPPETLHRGAGGELELSGSLEELYPGLRPGGERAGGDRGRSQPGAARAPAGGAQRGGWARGGERR